MHCDYDVLFGGRANGKSYDVCKNDIIDDYFKSGCTHEFGLVRRVGYGVSASAESLTKWFAEDLHKYLKEKYNCYIKVESNTFYIVNYDDEYEDDDYEDDGQFILYVYHSEHFVLDQTLAIKLPNYVKDELIATLKGEW